MFSSEFAGWDLGAQWFALRSAGWELEVRDESAGGGPEIRRLALSPLERIQRSAMSLLEGGPEIRRLALSPLERIQKSREQESCRFYIVFGM